MPLTSTSAFKFQQRTWLNADAPENMPRMLVALATFHELRSLLNMAAPRNMPLISVTLDTTQLLMSASKVDAPRNVPLMLTTLETSHAPINSLNVPEDEQCMLEKRAEMSVTRPVSHFVMLP
jgi:hypothetical protein